MFNFLISIFISFSAAQQGPTIDSMGGTGIAGRNPIDAAILNPAALAYHQDYYFGAGYFNGELKNADVSQFGATLADSTPGGILPGSFTYRQRKYDNGTDLKEHTFRLGLALPFTEKFFGGISLYKIKTNLPVGADYKQENADVSFQWELMEGLTWGAVSKAVFGSKDNVVFMDSKVMPATGTGFEYAMNQVKLRTDIYYYYESNPDKRMSYHFGGESVMLGDFRLRAGFSLDDYRRENRYTAGLGWEGPKLRAAYSYQHEFRQDLGDSHSIDIWFDL